MVSGDSTSIAGLSSDCGLKFVSIEKRINLIEGDPSKEETLLEGFELDDYLDVSARFRLWAGNIGALQHDKSSLDHRLRYSDLRIEVVRLLKQLLTTLTDLHSLITGEREQQEWYDDEGEQFDGLDDSSDASESELASELKSREKSPVLVTESSQLLIIIKDTVGSLLKLSMLIYNSSRRAKLTGFSRDQSYDTTFDISHVEETFPYASKNRPLLEKLGKANAQRRQWLAYRKRHHERLSSALESDLQCERNAMFPSEKRGWESSAAPIPVSDVIIPSTAGKKEETEATTFYDESLASLRGEHDQKEVSETSHSVSSLSEMDNQRVLLPKPPPESAGGKPFECPFCFTILTIESSRSWVKHVHSDLASYVCTFPDCTDPPFESRHQWFHHEMEVHRRQWACPFCESVFQTSQAFDAHVSEFHSTRLRNIEKEALLALASQPLKYIDASACPLCDYETHLRVRLGGVDKILIPPAKFRNHLGHHLEQVALFVLPKISFHEDGEQARTKEHLENAETGSSSEDDRQCSDGVTFIGKNDNTIESIEEVISILSLDADLTPHILDSAPTIALVWQPPHDFTPVAADFEIEFPDLIPRREESMFGGDLFTPGWVRGYNEAKEGFCGRCEVGHWVNIPDGTYELHLTYVHGIPPTGLPLPRPRETRQVEGTPGMWEAFCDACHGWRRLKKTKQGWNWFRHCLTEHQPVTTPKEEPENPSLYDAIKEIHNAQIEPYTSLLSENPNLARQTSHDSKILLHYAAESGNIDFVRLTLDTMRKLGINNNFIDTVSALDTTPLMLAVGQGNHDIVEELLIMGSDVNKTNTKGETALDIAAIAGYASISQLLIQHGADVGIAKVFQTLYSKRRENDHEHEKTPESPRRERDRASWNALMQNSYANNMPGVKQCLEGNQDLESTSIEGHTALMIAASRGNHKIVELLLDMGANIDATNMKGRTTLMNAVRANDHDTVLLLLSRGADVNHLCVGHGTALTEAAQRGLTGIMRSLLQCNADPESRSSHDWTPLMHCAYRGDKEGVVLLLEAGANVENGSQHDETALLLAAAAGHTEIVRILLEAGAYPEAGWARKEDADTAHINALVERAYPLGWTPLMVACQGGHTEVVRLLLQAGANAEPKSPMKKTATEIALEHGRDDIIKILKDWSGAQNLSVNKSRSADEGSDQSSAIANEKQAI